LIFDKVTDKNKLAPFCGPQCSWYASDALFNFDAEFMFERTF